MELAIVGMACLLPGAESPEEFWDALRSGRDLRTEGGREVFGTDASVPGGWGDERHRITATRGGFVPDTGPEKVIRWPLRVARQALADAGIPADVLGRTGLILGNYAFPTEESTNLALPLIHRAVTEGVRGLAVPPVEDRDYRGLRPFGLPVEVVGDTLGLGGPRIALDAACSSMLYALALARDYLAAGMADVVLAGAVCAPDPVLIHLSFSNLHAFPRNGVSQPFDTDSTGIVTGQGAGVFVVKRLADAIRDEDRIHAVVESIGLSNDGARGHMLTPDVDGQLDAYRHAYAGIDKSTVDYIECHATGTPIGDSTELRGVEAFFGQPPALGSVKGNVGHLLTVAGFTSMLKVILAMRAGVLPPTLGVSEPLAEQVVRTERPWTGTRRAGVSAFGFGGTNAHVVIADKPARVPQDDDPVRPPRLAVVGIGVRLGDVRTLPDLARVVRTGEPVLRPRPDDRWFGADKLDPPAARLGPAGYIDHAEVDLAAYHIPPADLGQFNPQHAVLFEAAEAALTDAALPRRSRVAVVVAMEMEPRTHTHRARFDIGAHLRTEVTLPPEAMDRLEAAVRDAVHEPLGANEVLSYIGNIMASRVSASRDFTGPSFTVSSSARALEVAGLLLMDPSIEAVVVGAVDLACGVENVLARTSSTPPGDGATVLVVTRPGETGYATIDAIRIGGDPFADTGISPDQVDYLEVDHPAALAEAYQTGGDELTCAVGSLTPLVGDTQQCALLASVAKVALCLHQAQLPPTPESFAMDPTGTPWCRLEAPQPWLRRGPKRIAAVGSAGVHLIMSSAAPAQRLGYSGPFIIPLSADTGRELAEAAARCLADVDAGKVPHTPSGRYTAVVVATDTARLRQELLAAQRDLRAVIDQGGEWTTPSGSYCTARPIGPDGRVAFVYPGAFTTYPGAGRDVFGLFPQLLADFEDESEGRFDHARLFPRARAGVDRRAMLRHEADLQEDIPVMLAAGTNIAVLHTRMLRDVLGLRPDGGFGYSLGESSMLFALGVWDPAHRDDGALAASPLFQDQLRGPKHLVRRTWRLPDDTPDSEVWSTHVVLAAVDDVRAAIDGLDRVFVTHVNTPGEVVLAGDPVQCRDVIARLGCRAAKAPANHVMHCPIVDPELDALAELNDYPLGTPAEGLELLSAYDYSEVGPIDRSVIAERIAYTLCSTVDFSRLVRTAHQRGFRYFVEVGPGATCTRWVTETLAGAEHLAVSVDRRGAAGATVLAQALARLISHGLKIDLGRLFGPAAPEAPARRTHTVRCGGEAIVDRVRRAAQAIEPQEVVTVEREPALRTMAGTIAQAHRAVLRAHTAVQERALDALYSTKDDVVWGPDDLLEFASGKVANVFGPRFAEADSYPTRVRLPEPPYLFVSRVVDIQGTTGTFEPASIITEYDIPNDAWYTVDGLTPCAVTIEAGQCDLLLISYLGIDFRTRGERRYRLLDSRLVFHGGLPRAGQTLRYEIAINRFVWNGDSLLFFFGYRCYADGQLILELLDACAGFFSPDELDDSRGVVATAADHRRRAAFKKTWFKPLARTDRTELSTSDLAKLAAGRPGDVFGPEWDQRADAANRSLRLPGEMLRMVDSIPRIDRLGGPCGLGALTAIKQLDPDGWYFRCHFPGDPVLAGSLVAEGGVQLLQVYAVYLGMHLVLPDAEFQSVPGLRTEVKVRGQITPATEKIRYEAEITGLTLLPRPTVVADITVYDGDKPIISMRDFGIQVREKPGTPYRPGPGGVPEFLGRRNHRGEPAFINELHLAHAAKGDLGVAMGPEFDVYGQRRAPHIPNGDFQFVDRIMSLDGIRGRLTPGAVMHTEYDSPPEAWYYATNAAMPNCVYMETSLQAAILLGYYLGATLASPTEEYSIRNLDGQATLVKDVDLKGRTIRQRSTLLSSQAVPGATLQRFSYELSCDDEVFYVGESLFGYFTADALANQVGLDAGKSVPPWRPVDEVVVDGGKYGKGYVYGRRQIDPTDWYFDCHFHRDPVMPGSLGVEAVLEALRRYVTDTGLAGDSPTFALPVGVAMSWKYRGQILRTDPEMAFELHVKDIRHEPDRLLVIADANVWRGSLRIYELTDLAVEAR
ncbi:beta-ketoacyl synthase N-terminal-like domain-containing protein [Actinocrispum wychmicini]|uniref:PfaB family protein n=1 Tax=Actinocrispum wychmicini TaxID=1213861 RepID=A0A4V6NNZ1_9PSEU|nr:beta-ketoacyl synthase N-terminal-like domain-containing protein [Actinocrispum wychmicini]TCO60620.1 PfaB family protein [Actinocrispum wychmicini]